MVSTMSKNELELYQRADYCFEEYENEIRNGIQSDILLQYQYDCLNLIDDLILHENSEPYFTTLFCIKEDLQRQIRKIEDRKDKIRINDITITRTTIHPISKPFLPSLVKVESIEENKRCEPESKKFKHNIESKNEQLEKLRRNIEDTLVIPHSTGLKEIAGLEEAKNILREAIIFPNLYPHLFNDGRKKWNKALLYGPPGTGKTQLVHCLAAEIKIRFYCVSNSDLVSSLVGESEKLIKMLFQHCQESEKQCLIFIDEIDSICRVRSNSEAEYDRRFKNQLLTQLSEMDRNPNNKIFFLACTNLPWDLDPAFVRRFQRRIYIPLPDRQARLQLLKSQSSKSDLKVEDWDKILDQTEGWSGSDITDLVNFAMFEPIKELQSADHWILTKNYCYMPDKNNQHSSLKLNISDIPADKIAARPVELADFFVALQNITNTISERTLKKFENFNKSFRAS